MSFTASPPGRACIGLVGALQPHPISVPAVPGWRSPVLSSDLKLSQLQPSAPQRHGRRNRWARGTSRGTRSRVFGNVRTLGSRRAGRSRGNRKGGFEMNRQPYKTTTPVVAQRARWIFLAAPPATRLKHRPLKSKRDMPPCGRPCSRRGRADHAQPFELPIATPCTADDWLGTLLFVMVAWQFSIAAAGSAAIDAHHGCSASIAKAPT